MWCELGDCRRFSRSLQVVRHTGLDVVVDASDLHRARGYLSRQGPSTLRWALFEAAHNASRHGSPDHDYYLQGEGPTRRQAGGDLRRPPVRPALLPPAAQPGSRRRLRRRRLNTAGDDVPRRPHQHHQVSTAVSSRHAHARRSLAGRPSNTDATALPTGDTRITIVVADDTTFVEHLGNAGRPHAAVSRPIASLHRPSGPSRSFVLASLRALHLDRRLRPGAPRAKRALTTRAHTGKTRVQNARLLVSDRILEAPVGRGRCQEAPPELPVRATRWNP